MFGCSSESLSSMAAIHMCSAPSVQIYEYEYSMDCAWVLSSKIIQFVLISDVQMI